MAKSGSSQSVETDTEPVDRSHDTAAVDSDERKLMATLEGRSCPHCEGDGTLERGEYKGNAAVVCDGCETPRVQVWSPSGDD
ncbi:hypothetical protein SAMN05444422_101399 [Halobiforma haloterrestris]|uniref:Uncharacterized protein n=1 Tax=Natronobacterium haloterrestre TaxID=148448 RepID=A0A1I1D8X6_NATHA|nr:HVO_A0556 family zinc finger protein [Halobiforma haloterrestris]SFB71247.1 hypothetical protein SAMN05444422_101399 [Halobiforma haloterrestris]